MAVKCPKCRTKNPDTQKFCGECATPLQPSKDISITKTLDTPIEEYTRGTTFAQRYEIIEKLGTGGMGSVYRVEDRNIGQDVALKLIRPEIASDKKTIERFRNELKTTRMISHRNVCRMFDLGETEGTHYITMEYVSGEDLKSFIKRSRRLDSGTAIAVAKQVCEGLSEAHRLGVVHRDLKSSNIMIDKEGNARIMDFGIARSLKAKGLTGEGIIIGTPEYMSPEQAEAKEVDHRSDIYSLGVILYEMVTGELPFEGDTPLSVAMKHKGEIPRNPKELNPQIREDLNVLILKCLEKDKESRYQSAEELYAGLNDIEKGLPVTQKIVPKRKPLTSKEITVTIGLKKLLIPVLIVIAIIVAAVIIWQLLPQKEVAIAPKIENSIAVISFKNQTGDEAYDYLRMAIPDLLITNLENTGNLHVATLERMHDLLEQMGKEDVEVIDEDLGFELCQKEGIEALVLGSFIKAGDVFATNVKVLNTENKRIMKSANSRGEGVDSILRTQIDDLSREISEGIGIPEQKIEASDIRIADFTTDSMEAYSNFLKGRESLDKMYYDEARQALEKAVILDPEFAYAYLLLGRAYSGLGLDTARNEAYEKAKAFSDKATEKERLYIEAAYASRIELNQEKRHSILKQITNKFPKEKQGHEELGSYYSYRDLYDEAIQEFNKALELDPKYGSALNGIAFVYVEIGDYEKAIEYFKRYISVSPGDANPLDSMAFCYFLIGRLDEAIAKFKEALEVKPDWSHSYWAISYIYAIKENYSEAMRWIDRAVDTVPSRSERSEGLLLKGFYYFWLGCLEESLREIRSASVLAEAEGISYMKAGADWMAVDVYYERAEFEFARMSLKNYLDISQKILSTPRYKVSESEALAYADIKEGRIDSAKARLSEMKSHLPELTPFFRDWFKNEHDSLHAEVLLAEGSIEEAIAVGKKFSARKFPGGIRSWTITGINFPILHDVLARAYQKKGEFDKAIAEYERLITFDPEKDDQRLIHPKYHYRLAKLYEQKGWEGKAIEEYEKFLELWKDADPGIAEVEDAKRRLALLKSH